MNRIANDVNRIATDVNRIATDVHRIATDVNRTATDVNRIEIDVNVITNNVNAIETDLNLITNDVKIIATDVSTTKRKICGIYKIEFHKCDNFIRLFNLKVIPSFTESFHNADVTAGCSTYCICRAEKLFSWYIIILAVLYIGKSCLSDALGT